MVARPDRRMIVFPGAGVGRDVIEYRKEYRCRKCHALCADQDTVAIHERFCEEEYTRQLSSKLRLPENIKRMLEMKEQVHALIDLEAVYEGEQP
jgi:hypothetical protein